MTTLIGVVFGLLTNDLLFYAYLQLPPFASCLRYRCRSYLLLPTLHDGDLTIR